MALRKIVQIDESKCNGCGLCVPNCVEGAIQIIDGKAKLVSDVYCDGLGACLGHCPEGAITIIEREAGDFSEEAVQKHLQGVAADKISLPIASATSVSAPSAVKNAPAAKPAACACPGSAPRSFFTGPQIQKSATAKSAGSEGEKKAVSMLGNWPVQLHLVPPHAPFLKGADLLLVADCVPFALPNFHTRFLQGNPVVIGCPKLDDGQAYVEKLAHIIQEAELASLTVVHMEVPCCTGLLRIAQAAKQLSGVDLPLKSAVISIRGEVLGE